MSLGGFAQAERQIIMLPARVDFFKLVRVELNVVPWISQEATEGVAVVANVNCKALRNYEQASGEWGKLDIDQ